MKFKLSAMLLAFAATVHAEELANPLITEAGLSAGFEVIKAEVVKGFKDPYSARFESLGYSGDSESGFIICGTVNGKNSYGAYSGASPFYSMLLALPGAEAVVILGSNPDSRHMALGMCNSQELINFNDETKD